MLKMRKVFDLVKVVVGMLFLNGKEVKGLYLRFISIYFLY